jgi:hypothetical protein
MADPVSWLVIERGWEVVDREGEHVGQVEEVLGDESRDIFDGLAVATNLLGKPRYIAAEVVAQITEGTVRLGLSAAEADRLPEYVPPKR